MEKKRIWRQPKLVVLARSSPEEAVLAGCKATSVSGPVVSVSGCKNKAATRCTGRCSATNLS